MGDYVDYGDDDEDDDVHYEDDYVLYEDDYVFYEDDSVDYEDDYVLYDDDFGVREADCVVCVLPFSFDFVARLAGTDGGERGVDLTPQQLLFQCAALWGSLIVHRGCPMHG